MPASRNSGANAPPRPSKSRPPPKMHVRSPAAVGGSARPRQLDLFSAPVIDFAEAARALRATSRAGVAVRSTPNRQKGVGPAGS